MQQPLAGLWQLSPLSDLSIPQDDIIFPAPLSDVLPDSLSEEEIAGQEWHLMHDIEVDNAMLSYPVIDLVVGGIDSFAEVRVNGEAVFDCDGSELSYRKDIKRYLNPGKNRIEILFLEQEEEWLLEDDICSLGAELPRKRDERLGIWEVPYLQFTRHAHLDYITTEQIWHQVGGCEFKVDLFYRVYALGLVSARIKFNGVSYQMPLDMRSNQCSALFQVDAPVVASEAGGHFYLLEVELDGQKRMLQVELNTAKCASHFPQ